MTKQQKAIKWAASIALIVALTGLFGDFGLIASLALIYLVVIN